MNLLILNSQADLADRHVGGAQWQLPDETNLVTFRTSMEEAINDQKALTTSVILPDGRRGDLIINAAAVVTASVVQVESGPA